MKPLSARNLTVKNAVLMYFGMNVKTVKTAIHTMIVVRTLVVVLTHCLTWFVTGVTERADGMFVLIVTKRRHDRNESVYSFQRKIQTTIARRNQNVDDQKPRLRKNRRFVPCDGYKEKEMKKE